MIPRSRGWGYSRVCEYGSAWTGCCSSVCRESECVGIGALLQKERGSIAGVLANEGLVPGDTVSVNPGTDGETLRGGDDISRNGGVAAVGAGHTQGKRSNDAFDPACAS